MKMQTVKGGSPMTQQQRRLWLINALKQDMPQYRDAAVPSLEIRQRQLLRALFNVRPPLPVSEEFLRVQDAYLQEELAQRQITDAAALPPCALDPRISLWQGDITALKIDAIVNAANSALLGCFAPGHACIDNIIHTMAGVQLRLACNELMEAQGHPEPTGRAKITPGFNLPAKYVLHTVGPIVDGPLLPEHERLLASCYRSCLALAEENCCQSIAFCCISTGVFMFPAQRAAEIAVDTVRAHYAETGSRIKTVFNVFKDSDLEIYRGLLF